jgi:hypothetical protein
MFSSSCKSYRGIKDSKPRLALVIVTIVLYLLSTTLFTLDAYAYLMQIKYDNLTIATPDETASDKALSTDILVLRAFFGSWFIFCLQVCAALVLSKQLHPETI